MSVKKDKTLAKVRTFAQDFKEHQKPDSVSSADSNFEPPKQSPPVDSGVFTQEKARPKKTIAVPKIVVKDSAKKPKTPPPKKEKKNTPPRVAKAPKKESAPANIPKITVKKKPQVPKKKVNTGAAANVITATKRAPGAADGKSLVASLSKWFSSLFKKRAKAKAPTYSVGATTHRKGVIKKATTKSGAVFTSDKETLREAIVRRRTEEEHKPEFTWTPNTEAGYDLLEAPHAVAAPKATEPTPEPIPEATPEPAPTPEPESAPIRRAPEPVLPPRAPEPIPPAEPIQTPVPTPTLTPPAEPTPERPNPQSEKVRPFVAIRDLLRGQTESLNTNAVALGLVAVIAGTLALVLVVQSVVGLFTDEAVIVVEETTPALLPGVARTTYLLPTVDEVAMMSVVLNTADIATYTEEEIQFADSTGVLLPTSELTRLLAIDLNPNFVQTITSLRLVVVDTIQHALVLEVTDSFTALGGMLEWEATMQKELDPILFVRELPAESTSFVDETYGDIDLRVLTDGFEEILVYGFVDQDTILIAKSTATFERLAN